MPDDPNQTGGQDRTPINVKQDLESRYWAERFGVSPEEVEDAVKQWATAPTGWSSSARTSEPGRPMVMATSHYQRNATLKVALGRWVAAKPGSEEAKQAYEGVLLEIGQMIEQAKKPLRERVEELEGQLKRPKAKWA